MRPATAIPAILVGLVAASPVLAAPGVAIRWDKCYGDAGVVNRNFACNTNSGTNVVIGSFLLAHDMLYPSNMEAQLCVAAAATPLPAWWSFVNAGACRQTSLVADFVAPPDANNCPDWMSGQGAGGIGAYDVGFLGPSSARILLAAAVPAAPTVDLFGGQEYFTFRLRLANAKTVGTGACGGC